MKTCRLIGLSALLAPLSCLALSPSHELSWTQPDQGPSSSCVSVAVADEARGELPLLRHRSGLWVEGSEGRSFEVILRNRCPGRVLAVVSMDGLNILTGSEASYDQPGYILAPGTAYRAKGWRKSDREIAKFYFSAPAESYADRVGKGGNLGVIGVAFFDERRPPPQPPMISRSREQDGAFSSRKSESSIGSGPSAPLSPPPASAADSSRASNQASASPGLGAGHGETARDLVQRASFARMSEPFKIASIRYDSAANLIRMGVLPRPRPALSGGSNPFPAQPQFVPDPPARR